MSSLSLKELGSAAVEMTSMPTSPTSESESRKANFTPAAAHGLSGASIASSSKLTSAPSFRVHDLVEKKVLTIWPPETYHHDEPFPNEVHRIYELNWYQRIYLFCEQPGCCKAGEMFSNCMMLVICLNIFVTVAATMHIYRTYVPSTCDQPACNNDPDLCPGVQLCEPQPLPVFDQIDAACVYIFTIEYMTRLLLCAFVPTRLSGIMDVRWDTTEREEAKLEHRPVNPEPYMAWYWQLHYYFWRPKNLVDMIAIMPYYVQYSGESANLSFIRVLRLFRVLRAFKMRPSGGVVTVVWQALSDSAEVLGMLLFVAGMIVLIYGTIIYNLEQGTYTISEAWPNGNYIRANFYDNSQEESPFKGALYGMYWAVVTMTTVGYGDLAATSPAGRVVSCMAALTGILFLALPISVLGNNFNMEFSAYFTHQRKMKRKKMEEASKKLLAVKLVQENGLTMEEALEVAASRTYGHNDDHGHKHDSPHKHPSGLESNNLSSSSSKAAGDEQNRELAAGGGGELSSGGEEDGSSYGGDVVDSANDMYLSELDSTWQDSALASDASEEHKNYIELVKRAKNVETLSEEDKLKLITELYEQNKRVLRKIHSTSETCVQIGRAALISGNDLGINLHGSISSPTSTSNVSSPVGGQISPYFGSASTVIDTSSLKR